jgi:hypothetical protein
MTEGESPFENDLVIRFALIPDTDLAEHSLFGKGAFNTGMESAATSSFPHGFMGDYQLVDVVLKGDENYIKYYTCREVMINPGQVLFASLPVMPGKALLQLPIELHGRFNLVVSRDSTPCIVNLRRPSIAKMAQILPRGSLILE